LQHHKVVKVVSYANKYGEHNHVATENTKLFEKINIQVHDNIVIVSEIDIDSVSAHKVSSNRYIVPTILKYLLNGQYVIYIPKSTRSVRTVVGKGTKEHLDFVTKNLSDSKVKAKKEYTLKLDPDYPIFFGTSSRVLKHLLLMSKTIKDLEENFNSSYMFLTRIHCGWV
jgi:hypothetical protein